MNKKITLFTDNSLESAEAKKKLNENNIEYETAIGDPDEGQLPLLLDPKSAVPFFGLEGVNQYVDLFGKRA